MAGVICDRSEAASEADVEKDGEECEERNATEEEGEEDTEDGVQDGSSRHALNCLFPCRNWDVLLGKDCEEVAVDTENDAGRRKLEESQASLAEAKKRTAEDHGVGGEVW